MTAEEIARDVDHGLEIVDRMARDKKELKAITERLKAAALIGEQIPLKEADREGKQFLAKGTTQTVPVIITADAIAQSFTKDSPAHARADAASNGKFDSFYSLKQKFEARNKDGAAFRREAAALLADAAPAFISACLMRDKHGIPKNVIKIDWGREDENEEDEE